MNKKTADRIEDLANEMEIAIELMKKAREDRSTGDPLLIKTAEELENFAMRLLRKDAAKLHKIAKRSILNQIIDFLKDC